MTLGRCCCCCCVGTLACLVLVVLAWTTYDYLGSLEGRSIERVLGQSELANPDLYDEIVLSDAQRAEYFRDGVTVVRQGLRLETLRAIRHAVDSAPKEAVKETQSWMASDAVLDFFVYGNLGGIAAQLIGSPNTQTAEESPAVYLWQDFVQIRSGGTNGWHMDLGECMADAPPNYTRFSLPRIVICLNETAVEGTVVLNQSIYAAGIRDKTEARAYWQGQLPFRYVTRFEEAFGHEHNTSLPYLPGVEFSPEGATIASSLQPGDLLVFSACAWHRSPAKFKAHELFLQPSFTPGSLHFDDFSQRRAPLFGSQGRHCDHSSSAGLQVGASGHPCHPQVYPPAGRPTPGTKLLATRERRYTLLEGVIDYLKVRATSQAQERKRLPEEL